MKNCFDDFCLVSGEKVFFFKFSVIFSNNISEYRVVDICVYLEISVMQDFGFYLGMFIINGRVSRSIYKNIVEKVNRYLNGWKVRCFLLVGRVILVEVIMVFIL